MSSGDAIRKLAQRFRAVGAPDPEGWARSEVEEGIPQLARYLFLRQAWRRIVADGDTTWIEPAINDAERAPSAPYAGVGLALKRLQAHGASASDLSDVVRGMQAQLLFDLCVLLSDPGQLEPEVEDVAWTLVQVSPEGEVLSAIDGLHESVLETDPTGREMRPRDGA